jgi:hypothetical protein
MPALDQGRIRLANVLIYIERTTAPARPLPAGVMPRPYGLAATALESAGTVLAAVGANEAVWLGFQAIDAARPAIVRIRAGDEKPLDALSGEPWNDTAGEKLTCPPDYALPGLRRPDGFLPFAAGETLTVVVDATPAPAELVIRLVSPAAFTRLTGIMPSPLDPDSAFKGYRLP